MATELGKAYVQIMPSAKGISGAISNELQGESISAGKKSGLSITGAIKGAIIAAGIGKLLGAAISEGGELQQSLGGIETLFKSSADTVKQYASQSFATAGVSANEYMQNVTSFSASLINSLGGDTKAAADLANTAMVDMSDNANKMGTDLELIQQTYQSLARGNYEMLDNLKLGYGGTKTEMQRLMKDAEKLTGEHYTVGDFADTVSAIHAIQDSLGITGTTALEASTTLTGSFNSMKAAAKDLAGNIALGMDISGPLSNLATSAATFLFGNLLPMLGNILTALPEAIITAIQVAGPILITNLQQLITTIVNYFITNGPTIMQQGMNLIQNLVNGFVQNFPIFMQNLSTLLNQAITFLMTNLPTWLNAGIEFVGQLAQGVINNLPTIVSSIVSLITQAIGTFASNLPQFLQKGIELVGKVAAGLIQGLPNLLGKIPGILSDAANAFLSFDWLGIGVDIISGIVNGIISAAGNIANALLDAAKSAFDGVLSFLGIGSPSKLAEKQIGRWIPPGMANGVDKNAYMIKDSMIAAAKRAFEATKKYTSSSDAYRLSRMGGFMSGPYAPVGNVTNQTVNQTINSAKVLSPREIALQTKSAMRRMQWV